MFKYRDHAYGSVAEWHANEFCKRSKIYNAFVVIGPPKTSSFRKANDLCYLKDLLQSLIKARLQQQLNTSTAGSIWNNSKLSACHTGVLELTILGMQISGCQHLNTNFCRTVDWHSRRKPNFHSGLKVRKDVQQCVTNLKKSMKIQLTIIAYKNFNYTELSLPSIARHGWLQQVNNIILACNQ